MFPVIYLLDEDGEATGTTYRFCSLACRDRFRRDCPEEVEEPTADGMERVCADDQEVCCTCGTVLAQITPTGWLALRARVVHAARA